MGLNTNILNYREFEQELLKESVRLGANNTIYFDIEPVVKIEQIGLLPNMEIDKDENGNRIATITSAGLRMNVLTKEERIEYADKFNNNKGILPIKTRIMTKQQIMPIEVDYDKITPLEFTRAQEEAVKKFFSMDRELEKNVLLRKKIIDNYIGKDIVYVKLRDNMTLEEFDKLQKEAKIQNAGNISNTNSREYIVRNSKNEKVLGKYMTPRMHILPKTKIALYVSFGGDSLVSSHEESNMRPNYLRARGIDDSALKGLLKKMTYSAEQKNDVNPKKYSAGSAKAGRISREKKDYSYYEYSIDLESRNLFINLAADSIAMFLNNDDELNYEMEKNGTTHIQIEYDNDRPVPKIDYFVTIAGSSTLADEYMQLVYSKLRKFQPEVIPGFFKKVDDKSKIKVSYDPNDPYMLPRISGKDKKGNPKVVDTRRELFKDLHNELYGKNKDEPFKMQRRMVYNRAVFSNFITLNIPGVTVDEDGLITEGKNIIEGKNFAIFDDFGTSGTTMDDAARVLLLNGASKVVCFVITNPKSIDNSNADDRRIANELKLLGITDSKKILMTIADVAGEFQYLPKFRSDEIENLELMRDRYARKLT